MIDIALVTLLKQYAPAFEVRPSTETVKVTDGVSRIIYSLIDSDRDYTDQGDTGLRIARYQLDYFAPKMSTCRIAADEISAGMDGYKGTLDSTVIHRVWFDSERFMQGSNAEGANNTVARLHQDCWIAYRI